MKLNGVLTTSPPECFIPEENNPYPLCVGPANPAEFAENDCAQCCLYVNYNETEVSSPEKEG